MFIYIKKKRKRYKICKTNNAINREMSRVKKKQADNGKYEKSIGFLKESTY